MLDAIAQALPPHYSPIRDAESDLAVGPYGYIMAINFLNRGVFSLVFVYSLTRTLRRTEAVPGSGAGSKNRYSSGLRLLDVWGVGAILLAIFPTDVPAIPVSWHGAIHLVVATIAFLAGALGALRLSSQFGQSQALRGVRGAAMALAVLAAIFCVLTLGLGFVSPHLAAQIGGLNERIFLAIVLLWMATVSIYLLRYNPPIGAEGSSGRKDHPPASPLAPVDK